MITIEETAHVGADHRIVLTLPASVTPGPHRVVLMVEEDEILPTLNDDPLAKMIGAYASGAGMTGRNAEDVLYGKSGAA